MQVYEPGFVRKKVSSAEFDFYKSLLSEDCEIPQEIIDEFIPSLLTTSESSGLLFGSTSSV